MYMTKLKHDNKPVNGITLGELVTDSISGFTGIAETRSEWINQCYRISVRPTTLDNGKVMDAGHFDDKQLKQYAADAVPRTYIGIHPGDEVTDSITGFKGIVINRSEYIFSEPRIDVQSKKLTKTGELGPIYSFDESQTVEYKKLIVPKKRTGGPGYSVPPRHPVPRC
jgi:hypothetical protein